MPVSYFFEEMPSGMNAADQLTRHSITPDEYPFDELEVQKFVKAYRAIPNASVRRSIFLAVKAVARYNTDKSFDIKEDDVDNAAVKEVA